MRPTIGSSARSSSTASATVIRIGETWNRSTMGSALGVRARIAALWNRRIDVPSSRSGISPANRSSAPVRRGKHKSACSESALSTRATSLNVLHSSNLASRRSRSDHNASSSSRSPSSCPGSNRRVLSSTSVAAISKNSVATSRSSACKRSTSAK